MTTAAIATYAYDLIEQARAALNTARNGRHTRSSELCLAVAICERQRPHMECLTAYSRRTLEYWGSGSLGVR
jgi:hypothetical protein